MSSEIQLGEVISSGIISDIDGRAAPGDPFHLIWTVMQGLLIQASSGQGKSWLIRRLVEQLAGRIQIIIIDPEGEFSTLREKFEFLLISSDEGGDYPCDPRTAEVLTLKLMELGISAILDVSELSSKQEYVKIVAETLIDMPRDLRHPVIVVLDEVHLFAPQSGESDDISSTKAVIELCARGRKRGIIPVFATQRMAKVHKDAIAELHNYLIGGTMLDSDVRRAIEHLGIEGKNKEMFSRMIRQLNPGEFYALGRALTRIPELFRVGPVQTSHPQVGQYVPPVKPPKNIQKLLPDLAMLPKVDDDLKSKSAAELRLMVKTQAEEIDALRLGTNVTEVAPAEVDWDALDADLRRKVRETIKPLWDHDRALVGFVDAIAGPLASLANEYNKVIQHETPRLKMPKLDRPEGL